MTVDRSAFICIAVAGTSIALSATSLYISYRMNCNLLREIVSLSEVLSDIRKEISDLKFVTRRRPLSLTAEEADVYYDFSDEGDDFDEPRIQDNFFTVETDSADALKLVDGMIEKMNSEEDCSRLYRDILSFKDRFFNDPEYLWRLAKAAHTYSESLRQKGDKENSRTLAYDALHQASTALALTDDSADVHKWYAICIGSIGEYETVQNKIKNGFTFKEHTLAALKLSPSDDSLHHMLGRWCYEVALLSWIERKVAKTLYGSVPESTMEEARNHFLEAENLRGPKVWNENRLFIAKTYIGDGQYAIGLRWLDRACEGGSTDEEVAKEVTALLKKYSGYRT